MKALQPQIIVRGALAVALLGGAALAIPPAHGAQARGIAARLGAVPAQRPHLRGAARQPRATVSLTHSVQSSSPVTLAVTLFPPQASGRPRRLRALRSQARGTRRLFGLGLAAPRHRSAPAAMGAGATLAAATLPASVDLSRYDPPVGNQGQVGSCASWATGYTLLGWYANRYGLSGAPYAPMYVYAQLVQGVNTGTTFEGNFGVEQQQGIDTQADYWQGNYDYTDQPTAAERANAAQYHITGYTQIYAQGSGSAQQAIEAALAGGQPVAVGIPVYSNFMYATAAAPLVDVPPAGATYFGGHAVVGVKYDANGLWIENQWGATWGLNGYAELSWAFVNQYLWSAYTIPGFQAPATASATSTPPVAPSATPPAAATSTASPVPPTATPVAAAQLWVTPSSGPPGTHLTINGSGFGAGTVTVSWNGSQIAQVNTSDGSFSLAESLSSTAAPGPRTVSAVNPATGQSATTTFQVTSTSSTATATAAPPTATATVARPTATATAAPSSTPVAPTATPAGPTPTAAPASVATLLLSPSAAPPGSALTITGQGFHALETVDLYWNGTLVAQLSVAANGTFSYSNSLSPSAAPGTRTVVAQGSSGDRASATFTVLAPAAASATPSPAASSTPPAASPTPAASIPTSGSTSNGCAITTASGQAEAQLLTLLNQDRAAAGVPPLTWNAALSVVARTHSCDMFLHQQLSHNGSDGSSPFQRMAAAGFGMPPYMQEGENVGQAAGMQPSDAVAQLDQEMMAEPLSTGTHHWNIVNSGYKIVGVGVIVANGQTWVTEDFAG